MPGSDDRCLNAQRMEEAFYSGKKDPENEKGNDNPQAAPAKKNRIPANNEMDEKESDAALLMKLLQKPEMAALLKTLAASL